MALRVVGVGLGRTGTNSLKLALERLLGGKCHHMLEVIGNPEQERLWTAAAQGDPDWAAVFEGFVATVDWPSCGFWRELTAEYPDALVLLSRRRSADEWWTSARNTIFMSFNGDIQMPPEMAEWMDTVRGIVDRNGVDPTDEATAKAAYEAHLEVVRATVPAGRLLEWTAGDGWDPICKALGLAVPDEPFPHVNTTEDFRAMFAAFGEGQH